MVSKAQLLSNLSPYVGSAKIVKYDQVTSDIIKELVARHNVDAKEYDRIYKYFWDGNIETTAKKIFDFIKKNIKYDIESGSRQTLKTPGAILITGKADCKQYSQFIAGILDAIKRNEKIKFEWFYRFASYNNQKAIQHVFVVIKLGNREIWIDPVLDSFNKKKEFTYNIDKQPKQMAIYQISGIEDQAVGKTILGKGLKAAGKAAKAVSKVVVKVGTTPARNAFLLLVRLNVLHLATKLGAKLSKVEPQLSKLWKGLGGNWNTLKSTIIKGAKNKIGCSPYAMYNPNSVGTGEPVSSTAVAMATPIIIAIEKILKELGIDPKELMKAGKDILIDKVEQVIDDNLPPALADQVTNAIDAKAGREPQPSSASMAAENFTLPNIENPAQGDIEIATKTSIDPATGTATMAANTQTMDYKKLLIPAAAIAAVYFITKKK
jgi:hypothetical protein